MRRLRLNSTQIILLGFAVAILIGALLLATPISSASGEWTPFVDALFTATTSVCVTGLVVVNTAAHWSLFGKIVILFLIQIGGLGIVAIVTAFFMLLRRKISLRDRVLLEEAFNLSTLSGLLSFLRRVLFSTFLVEGVGALLCLPVFLPQYGAHGIWVSLFHSVSSFCNAGIDILGADSLVPYAGNVWLSLVTMALIVLGGLGFIVWFDILRAVRAVRGHYRLGAVFRALSLHSRIVLIMTGALLFGGALLIFLFEFQNPDTLGSLPLGEKVLAALFQSVTLRTAGFATISQKSLTAASALLSLLLMFIGGSPIGTAGGTKTTTAAILLLSARATVRGEEETVVMHRTIDRRTVGKAFSVFFIFLLVCLLATLLMLLFVGGDLLDVLFEVFSAVGTVGLSRDYTGTMNEVGKWIIIFCMYLGRVGPISLAIALGRRAKYTSVRYPDGNVTVG